jgi:hypothetical protein
LFVGVSFHGGHGDLLRTALVCRLGLKETSSSWEI